MGGEEARGSKACLPPWPQTSYPSHFLPVDEHRLQLGRASSHLTRRILNKSGQHAGLRTEEMLCMPTGFAARSRSRAGRSDHDGEVGLWEVVASSLSRRMINGGDILLPECPSAWEHVICLNAGR